MFRRFQTGLVQNYALLMLFGVFAFVEHVSVRAVSRVTTAERYESLPVAHPVHAARRRAAPAARQQAERERHPLDREHRRASSASSISVPLWFWYNPQGADFQFVERAPWIPSIGAEYFLGVDGLSTLLILLTTLMGFIAILSSWTAITERVKEYYIFLLVLQTGMLGAFMSLDFLLFFLFWEVMLVPMYFLIGIWGSANRLYSAIKFFLYTLVGSVVMLLGILALYFYNHSVTGVYTFDVTQFQQAERAVRPAVVGVPRVLPRLRDQGADVPVPHLAARRAHRRADRRLGDPGGRPAEDGHLRVPALQPADPARRDARTSCR